MSNTTTDIESNMDNITRIIGEKFGVLKKKKNEYFISDEFNRFYERTKKKNMIDSSGFEKYCIEINKGENIPIKKIVNEYIIHLWLLHKGLNTDSIEFKCLVVILDRVTDVK